MRAKLKRFHSPDVSHLDSYLPAEPDRFGLLVQMMVGPADSEGEESFDVMVCTTKWLEDRYGQEELVVLRHHVLVHQFDYEGVCRGLRERVDSCTGDTWQQIAQQVGRIGKWEFEDYT